MNLIFNLGICLNSHSTSQKVQPVESAWVPSLGLYQFILYFIFVCMFYFCLRLIYLLLFIYKLKIAISRASPGVSPASPQAKETPLLGATKKEKKKLYIYIKEKKNCIHKIKFLIEGKKKYLEGKNKKNYHKPRAKKIFKDKNKK